MYFTQKETQTNLNTEPTSLKSNFLKLELKMKKKVKFIKKFQICLRTQGETNKSIICILQN